MRAERSACLLLRDLMVTVMVRVSKRAVALPKPVIECIISLFGNVSAQTYEISRKASPSRFSQGLLCSFSYMLLRLAVGDECL